MVQAESMTTLTLRQGRMLRAFDRLSRTATQQGKVVAPFGTIRHIRVFEEPSPAGRGVVDRPAAGRYPLGARGLVPRANARHRVGALGQRRDRRLGRRWTAHLEC